jgi:hypothetical protein
MNRAVDAHHGGHIQANVVERRYDLRPYPPTRASIV